MRSPFAGLAYNLEAIPQPVEYATDGRIKDMSEAASRIHAQRRL